MNILALLASTRVGQTILWVGGLAVTLGAIALRLMSIGRAQERAKQDAAALDNLRSREKTDDEIARLDDRARRERLARWVPDDK